MIENPSSNTSTAARFADLRFPRFAGINMKKPGNTSARDKFCLSASGQCRIAEEVAMVAMVSVVLTTPPLGVTLEGLNEQLAPAGNPLQLGVMV